MTLNFNAQQVADLAKEHRVIPVIRTLFSGTETPVSIFEKLAATQVGSFLLESAEAGVWSRYSFIGVKPRGMLIGELGSVRWEGTKSALPDSSETLPARALDALKAIEQAWTGPALENVPPLVSGLVGLLGWNIIQEIEKLPTPKPKDFESPDIAFALFEDLVVVDHSTSSLLLIANIFVDDQFEPATAHQDALARISQLVSGLQQPAEAFLAEANITNSAAIEPITTKASYLAAVDAAKEYIRIGDVFQVVLGQRFDHATEVAPLDVYRVLRALNPSPYMYLLNFAFNGKPFAVVGSSPEALVKISGRRAITHPIAGSRPRGADAEADNALADNLLADAKERAEHLMLVDLARNDLLKVCEPDSVTVTEFMKVERFSHIMHLVSTVEGDLQPDANSVDVFKATFPAGTLSGAPKPRALEIIEQLEQKNRGIFGGVVGYFDFAGNADLAITIRTALISDGVARVQAGAGLVLDSVPETEYQETVSKASAPMRAVLAAEALKRVQ
jgi:anthranilate synthase component 1